MNSKIHCHNSKLVIEFLQSIPTSDEVNSYLESTLPAVVEDPKVREQKRKSVRRKAIEEQKRRFMDKKRKLFLKQMERRKKIEVQHRADIEKRSDRKFEKMYSDLMKERDQIMPRVNQILGEYDSFRKYRKEELHRTWHKEEFEPIEKSIKHAKENIDIQQLEERKSILYSKYLDASNKKGGVFRDIVIPEDYDPFEARKYNLRYKALPGQRKMKTKDKRLRVMLDTKLWGKGIVESTPHGRYSFQNRYNPLNFKKSKQYLKNTKSNHSRLGFDHFTYPRGNKKPRGGKKMIGSGAFTSSIISMQ